MTFTVSIFCSFAKVSLKSVNHRPCLKPIKFFSSVTLKNLDRLREPKGTHIKLLSKEEYRVKHLMNYEQYKAENEIFWRAYWKKENIPSADEANLFKNAYDYYVQLSYNDYKKQAQPLINIFIL